MEWKNAAELDRYITAEKAFNAAKDAGRSDDEAKDAARAAVAEKRKQQLLDSLGPILPPILP